MLCLMLADNGFIFNGNQTAERSHGMGGKLKCPRCGCTETKPVGPDELKLRLVGFGSLRCKKCNYLVHAESTFRSDLMSPNELIEFREKSERFTRDWFKKR